MRRIGANFAAPKSVASFGVIRLYYLSICVGHRYGFVVYMDPSVTDIACAGLNGMRMGERTLTVRRATEVR